MNRLFRALAGWWSRRFGPRRDPRAALHAWIDQLQAEVPRLDNGIARLKGRVIQREHEFERTPADAPDRGRLVQAVDDARTEYNQAVALRQAFLVRMDAEVRRVNEVLRDADDAKWKAEIARIGALMANPTVADPVAPLMAELRAESALDAARLRVAADLAAPQLPVGGTISPMDEPQVTSPSRVTHRGTG